MLLLDRYTNQSILIGTKEEMLNGQAVRVLVHIIEAGINNGRPTVKLGIDADKSVVILREELAAKWIAQQNAVHDRGTS